jgi:formate dehydrogenase iron-sulfur subunit
MKAILVDVTRCTGCEQCVDACVEVNHADPARAQLDRATTKDGLSANRLLSVPEIARGRFARLSCMHCLEPSCAAACLVGAITKTPEGPVVYDQEKCIGCRYCMLACPFHIPRYEWDRPIPYVKKCTMCADRLAEGRKPACVDACPHEALRFGERDSLLRAAHALIAAGGGGGGGGGGGAYLPRVWGEDEFGGTSVLYVSDLDLGVIGWPAGPKPVPIPALTGPLIAKTPFIGLGVAGSLLGISWVIRRRMKLAAEGAAARADEAAGEDSSESGPRARGVARP